MNRKDLANVIRAHHPELTVLSASCIVNDIFDAIIKEVKMGASDVTIAGFGSFQSKICKARVSRNPKTGEVVQVPAKSSIRFKVSPALIQEDRA
jgi:nucleoid DNA-binding protein